MNKYSVSDLFRSNFHSYTTINTLTIKKLVQGIENIENDQILKAVHYLTQILEKGEILSQNLFLNPSLMIFLEFICLENTENDILNLKFDRTN